jgi:hypothetical protein
MYSRTSWRVVAHRFTAFAVAASALGPLLVAAQHADPAATIVDRFFPQSLVDGGSEAGPFLQQQCFAVVDSDQSGAPRTIVAAYTDGTNGIVRVLRHATTGFAVVAEPTGLDFTGFACSVSLLDVDGDRVKEAHVSFRAESGSSDWVFRWNGKELVNLTPVTPADYDGRLRTDLRHAQFVDLDSDGIMEIHVGAQHLPRGDTRLPNVVYRWRRNRFVADEPAPGSGRSSARRPIQ